MTGSTVCVHSTLITSIVQVENILCAAGCVSLYSHTACRLVVYQRWHLSGRYSQVENNIVYCVLPSNAVHSFIPSVRLSPWSKPRAVSEPSKYYMGIFQGFTHALYYRPFHKLCN